MVKNNGTNVPTGRDDTYDKTEVHRKSIEELFETSFNENQKKALLGMDIGSGGGGKLVFDEVPTAGSKNPVTSNGIYETLNPFAPKDSDEEPDEYPDVQTITVTYPLDLGGINGTTGEDAVSSNRARTAGRLVPFYGNDVTYTFPEGTKHRFFIMSGTSVYSLTDWSTALTDHIDKSSFDVTTSSNKINYLRILVGYTDDRTISVEEMPWVKMSWVLTSPETNAAVFADAMVGGSSAATVAGIVAFGTGSDWVMSYPIPVTPRHTYYASYMRGILMFDESMRFVKYVSGNTLGNHEITIPEGIAYMCTSWHPTADLSDAAWSFSDISDPDSFDSQFYFSILGDSISAYKGYVPTGYFHYYDGVKAGVTDPSQMWWSVLSRETGLVPLVMNAFSGSAITQLEEANHLTRIPMSSDERCNGLHTAAASPHVIIIAGGVNDWSYVLSAQGEPLLTWDGTTVPVLNNNFTEAYACMLKKLHTNYPNAIIVCLSTFFVVRNDDNGGFTRTRTVEATNNTWTMADYDKAIEHVCKIMRVPFIDIANIGFSFTNYYPTYCQDSETIPTHPNAKGQAVIGKAIAEKIKPIIAGFLSQANV